MFNSKIASLEARIARLESRLIRTAAKFTPRGIGDGFDDGYFGFDPFDKSSFINRIEDSTLRNFFLTLATEDSSVLKNKPEYMDFNDTVIGFKNFIVKGKVLFAAAEFGNYNQEGRVKLIANNYSNDYGVYDDAIHALNAQPGSGVNFVGYVQPTVASLIKASRAI
jgi:hypothetical protein